MNETRIYADAFETTFANTKEMLEFLAERAKASRWIRKPTRMLRLVPLEKEAETIEKACTKQLEGIVEDTEKNTQLVLKINGEVYPVRDCAMHTILKRAGVSGTGLRKLEKATYAKVINYCLKVARGDALIKIADGKVSAVHGGDEHDYCVLDMEAVFSMTCDYLKAHFSGSAYLEGSGTYDHSIASAMWTLEGNQELLDTYRQALKDHDLEDKALAPALRLTTSDVAASGANLYPMMTSKTNNRTISLGSPIKLSHDKGATLQDFRKNLDKIFSRYQEAMNGISSLMDIEIENPVNCLHLVMKEIKISQKIRNEVENYVLQVRHYMAVMNIKKAYIACLYGNNENEFVYRFLERDEMEEQELIDQEEYFWHEYVEKKVEPPYNGKADLVLASIRRYKGFADKTIPEITISGLESRSLERFLMLAEEKSQLERRKKEIDAEQKALSVPFVELLGQGCKAVMEDGSSRYKITYNPTIRTQIGKEQMEKLKIQHPDIYEEYASTSESRTFRIKKEAA